MKLKSLLNWVILMGVIKRKVESVFFYKPAIYVLNTAFNVIVEFLSYDFMTNKSILSSYLLSLSITFGCRIFLIYISLCNFMNCNLFRLQQLYLKGATNGKCSTKIEENAWHLKPY